VLMITQQLIDFLPLLTQGAVTQTAGNGIVGIAATDCASPPVGVIGATVEVLSGTTPVGDDPYDLGALAGEDAAGFYLVANAPPGAVTVRASYVQNGTTYEFLTNTATVFADAITEAQIKPGY
jgi:hypothetical protein